MRMISWIGKNSPVRYEALHATFHRVPKYKDLKFEDILQFLIMEGIVTYEITPAGTFIRFTYTEDESK